MALRLSSISPFGGFRAFEAMAFLAELSACDKASVDFLGVILEETSYRPHFPPAMVAWWLGGLIAW
jgi:hypothetical protein